MKDKHLQRFIEAGLGVGYYKQETSKVIAFEEWMKYNNYSLKGMDEHEAEFLMREAWNYQQKRIKLLEQRVIDLQGHDDLSYIDKKLSEQEGE
jgi:ferritin-like protein